MFVEKYFFNFPCLLICLTFLRHYEVYGPLDHRAMLDGSGLRLRSLWILYFSILTYWLLDGYLDLVGGLFFLVRF